MSDPDSLIVTFQRQLSDVLDTVVKTAMFEVTRLVEINFLEEVKRRTQQVDSLRRQLEEAWRREELVATEMLKTDIDEDGAPKEEEMCGQRSKTKSTQADTIATPCFKEGGDSTVAMNVKTEEEDEQCSDAHHGETSSCDSRVLMERNPEMPVRCENSTSSPFDLNPKILSIMSSIQDETRDLCVSEGSAAEVKVHISENEPKSLDTRLQNTDAAYVRIKQEVIEDKDDSEDRPIDLQNTETKSDISSFSRLVNQIRGSLDEPKRSHTVQERIRLLSKVRNLNPGKTIFNFAALSSSQSSGRTLSPPRAAGTFIPTSTSALSDQQVHPHEKQSATRNLTAVPWAHNKTQSTNFLLHADSHQIQRHAHRCGQCGKCFPHPSNLKAHLQIHSGERPFSCSLCGRGFTKLSNLKAHRRVHTGEKPFCCLRCGKRFTQNCNLKRHQRACDMGREGNA